MMLDDGVVVVIQSRLLMCFVTHWTTPHFYYFRHSFKRCSFRLVCLYNPAQLFLGPLLQIKIKYEGDKSVSLTIV